MLGDSPTGSRTAGIGQVLRFGSTRKLAKECGLNIKHRLQRRLVKRNAIVDLIKFPMNNSSASVVHLLYGCFASKSVS